MYRVKYRCSNCYSVFIKVFKRGERAPDSIRCDICGCMTAKKVGPDNSPHWKLENQDKGRITVC